VISREAVEWAWAIVEHQTRQMLFQAGCFVAENPFHAECLKFLKKLREAPGREMEHSKLLKRMKTDAQSFHKIVETLQQQDDIELLPVRTPGRTGIVYRLVGGGKKFDEGKEAASNEVGEG